ncbi:MAG: sigma-70 family RNA polymerase sigma factor [Verrucomicrobiota bacterium]
MPPPPTTEDEDRQAMVRLASGHEASLDELMGRHAERLFHYLNRLLQDESEAADLAQEAFVRVYQHRARFNPAQKFSTWIYAIATNLARDRWRWRARRPEVPLDAKGSETGEDLGNQIPQPGVDPQAALIAAERGEMVREAIARLPEDLRVPLVLAEYEQQSHEQIGAVLGCSAKAIEMRLYRARKQLREHLGRVLQT